jgi:hypothetical protein
MHIESVRIKNYRSILDSTALTFSPGFNLVVGANNVGKSSILLCLATRFTGEPHKSITTLQHRDEPLNPKSQVDITFVVTGGELRRLLGNLGAGDRYFPWPAGLELKNERAAEVLDRLLNADAVHFQVSAFASAGSGIGWELSHYPATRLYKPNVDGGQYPMLRFGLDPANRRLMPLEVNVGLTPVNDFGITVAQLVAQRIYRFSAERLSLGSTAYGASTELVPEARNLAEVLNILQGNPERFRDYCDLVREVFPSIQKVSLRPSPVNAQHAEIMIWQVDPALEREDLAMPLSQCGTGVGQVLAMLYVAKTSDQPRTIIIDEPGSFLHPGASRSLISILKRFSQHQYIIATHSPEIIAELSDAPVTVVRWEDSKSVIEQFPHTTGKIAEQALNEVGARLSDVFGFDKVLWVEGQSDALSLKALLTKMGKPQRRVAILPVHDTGSFKRRKIAEVLSIYRKLSMGDALLPPAVLFIFFRDGRSEKEMEDAKRQSAGKLRFLTRRMFENYLLNPAAISTLMNEDGVEHGIATATDAVAKWMNDNGGRFCSNKDASTPFTPLWIEHVDGASLLESLFSEMSTQKLFFQKTVHTPRLTELVHGIDPTETQKILDLVADVIQ